MKPLPPDELAFIEAIHAEREEQSSYLAYADWLTDHNDPRGDLIRQSMADPNSITFEDYLGLIRPFFEPLPKPMRIRTIFPEGLLFLVGYNTRYYMFDGDRIEQTVSPILGLHLDIHASRADDLRAILSHPMMRRVHQMRLDIAHDPTYEQLRHLAECPRLPKLERFELGCGTNGAEAAARILGPVCRVKFLTERRVG